MIKARNMNAAKPSWRAANGKTKVVPWNDHFFEELKRALRACKVFVFYPIFWVCYGQFSTNFVTQAGQMQGHGMPNDFMQNFDPISILIFTPLLDRILYPLLRRQFFWFKKTQFGDIKNYDREAYSTKEAYRWRGRSVQHILTSGLDDYPRPQPPHPGELHVDLISWMGMTARVLAKIADFVGLPEDVREYNQVVDGISHNLVDLHWSEAAGCFCDATIDVFEEHALVCHKGYISLFPFLLGLLESHDPKLGKLLDLLGDEEELFSPHGIRSLSKKSEFYGTDENYWRSPVWININYLAVVQLRVSSLILIP